MVALVSILKICNTVRLTIFKNSSIFVIGHTKKNENTYFKPISDVHVVVKKQFVAFV